TLRDARGGHRVGGTGYGETEGEPPDPLGETRWIERLAAVEGLPSAIVAQGWLDRDDVEEVLTQQAACPLVRGIRHKPVAAPSPDAVVPGAPGSMGDPRWRAGFSRLARHRLSFDLQTPWGPLAAAAALARASPDPLIALTHRGLPADRTPEGLRGWREAMARLAREPNVAVKISGLGVPGQPWTGESNGEIVLRTVEA